MKKAINKGGRHEIVISMVVEACGVTAQNIIDDLTRIRLKVHDCLLGNWEDQYPGISRQDQMALLQSHGANCLTFRPTVYGVSSTDGTQESQGEFGKLTWQNSGTDAVKARKASMAMRIVQQCTGASAVFSENISSGYHSTIGMVNKYVDIIHGHQPPVLHTLELPLPDELDPVTNGFLLRYNTIIMDQLHAFKALVDSAEDSYLTLYAALAPIKTAQELAELMPEAVKHFPASLTYVKPTKELADPAAINEIRAKLRKGLPI